MDIRPNPLLDENGMCSDPQVLAEKMKSKLEIVEEDCAGFAYSQPTDLRLDREEESVIKERQAAPRLMSFSQPTINHAIDDLESPTEYRANQVSVSVLLRIFDSYYFPRIPNLPNEDCLLIFSLLLKSLDSLLLSLQMLSFKSYQRLFMTFWSHVK
jgi:hypothetical protein